MTTSSIAGNTLTSTSLHSGAGSSTLLNRKNTEDMTDEEKLALIIMDRHIPRTRCKDISPAVAKLAKVRNRHKREVRFELAFLDYIENVFL